MRGRGERERKKEWKEERINRGEGGEGRWLLSKHFWQHVLHWRRHYIISFSVGTCRTKLFQLFIQAISRNETKPSLHSKPAEAPNGSSESQHVTDNHGLFKAPVVVTHAAPRSSGPVKDLHCALVILRIDAAIDNKMNWVLKGGGGNCVCVGGWGEDQV